MGIHKIPLFKKILEITAIFLLFFVFSLAAYVFLMETRILRINHLKTWGMYPSIRKDQYIVSTILLNKYSKGDIVIYRTINDSFSGSDDRVARVNGVGGDVVNNAEGVSLKVPIDNYYLLMDEGFSQEDSRKYGFISSDDILGKVILVLGRGDESRL